MRIFDHVPTSRPKPGPIATSQARLSPGVAIVVIGGPLPLFMGACSFNWDRIAIHHHLKPVRPN